MHGHTVNVCLYIAVFFVGRNENSLIDRLIKFLDRQASFLDNSIGIKYINHGTLTIKYGVLS